MVRPTSLLRSDSQRPEFTAPVNYMKRDTIDCGISVLPCCLPPWFQRFATPQVFVLCLVLLSICQGSAQAYLGATLEHVRELFQYPPTVIDWLLVSHDLFLGVFGLVVAHHGSKLHRAAWLGGLACLQGVSCFLVIIPYMQHRGMNNTDVITNPAGPNLCHDGRVSPHLEIVEEHEKCWLTLAVFVILQLCIGLANASFYSHGLTYIDDNVEENTAPYYLAVVTAVRLTSVQSGSYMAWYFLRDGKSWWIGYPIVGSSLIFAGTIIATFPRKLVGTVVKQAAASILDIATGFSTQSIQVQTEIKYKKSFFASLKRVVTNKIIIVNTLASVFMFVALMNFSSYEAKYMESQFYVPMVGEGFNDPWTSRLLTNILKDPLISLHIIISGLLIAKFKPRASRLAVWNILSTAVVGGIVLSYVFIDCNKGTIVGEYKGHLVPPYCSRGCHCDAFSTKFEPVCTQNGTQTYFSPCHAGCRDIMVMNNIRMYSDCLCGFVTPHSAPAPVLAAEGACDNAVCAMHWKLFQSFTILAAALIGSGFIGNILINLRAVKPSDKAMALAFEICMVGILVHVPGKFIYKAIADNTCQYQSNDGYSCSLQNARFGDYLSLVTAALLLVAVFLDCGVLYLVRNLSIFPEEDEAEDQELEMPESSEMSFISPPRSFSPPPRSQSTLEYRRPPRPPQSRTTSTRLSEETEEEPLTNGNAEEFRRQLGLYINRRSTLV